MVRHRRWARSAAALLCLSLIGTACLGESRVETPTSVVVASPNAGTPQPEPTKAKPERGGTVIVALPREPDTLNFTLTEQQSARWVIDALNARMIRIRADGSYEPQLLAEVPTLENGGISEDGRIWTVHFKPKLTWSDGQRLDGQDLVFTWRTIAQNDYSGVNRAVWTMIGDIQLSNDNLTATMSLRQPLATLTEDILSGGSDDSGGFLLPAHILESLTPNEIARAPYGTDEHVGSGAFKLAKWEPGEQIILDRNDHFVEQPARLDRIVFRILPPDRQAATLLATGEIDLGIDLPETSLVDLRQIQNTTVHIVPKAGAVEMFLVNLNDPDNLAAPHPILADPAVREALVLGFDRQRVVTEYLRGQASVAITPLDATRWFNDQLVAYPFDPEQAAKILDTAGWIRGSDGVRVKDGVRLSFTHTTVVGDDARAALRQRIQRGFIQDMAAIGVDVKARNVAPREYDPVGDPTGIVATRGFDVLDIENNVRSGLAEFRWRFSSDGIPTRFEARGGNIMGYRDSIVDRSLDEQAHALNPVRRDVLLDTAQQRIYEDLPALPVYVHLEIDISRSYVQGLEPGAISGLWWNVEEWWVDKDQAAP